MGRGTRAGRETTKLSADDQIRQLDALMDDFAASSPTNTFDAAGFEAFLRERDARDVREAQTGDAP